MPIKVLVVDDEHDVEVLFRQRFRREMRRSEIDFFFAFSGEEALEVLEQQAADMVLVLSDINMPGMNGLDLLKHVKGRHPALPVYMVTAYGNDEYRRRAEEIGTDAYLTKPVDFRALKQRIFSLAEA